MIEVYDGDGFKMRVHCWPPFCKSVNVRILNMDAPEMDGPTKWERDKAIRARDYLRKRLRWAIWITVDVQKWDKWGGRVLAYVNINGKCIAETMIAEGLARPYDGGKREPWTRPRKRERQVKWWLVVCGLSVAIFGGVIL